MRKDLLIPIAFINTIITISYILYDIDSYTEIFNVNLYVILGWQVITLPLYNIAIKKLPQRAPSIYAVDLTFRVGIIVILAEWLIALIIWGYREDINSIKVVSSAIGDVVSIIIPAVGNIPKVMIEEGFYTRIEVTQSAMAFSYAIGISIFLYLLREALRDQNRSRRVYKNTIQTWKKLPPSRLVSLLIYVMPLALLVFFLFATSIRKEPFRKEMLGNFEEYDLLLFLRVCVSPMIMMPILGFWLLMLPIFWRAQKFSAARKRPKKR